MQSFAGRRPVALALIAVALVMVACRSGGAGAGASGASPSPTLSPGVELHGTVTAGPTCPVERDPPDPSCAPRPVRDATIVVQDAGGREVARPVSDDAGRFSVALAPGTYTLVPQPVNGMRGGLPVNVEIRSGVQPAAVEISYDTGIR